MAHWVGAQGRVKLAKKRKDTCDVPPENSKLESKNPPENSKLESKNFFLNRN